MFAFFFFLQPHSYLWSCQSETKGTERRLHLFYKYVYNKNTAKEIKISQSSIFKEMTIIFQFLDVFFTVIHKGLLHFMVDLSDSKLVLDIEVLKEL